MARSLRLMLKQPKPRCVAVLGRSIRMSTMTQGTGIEFGDKLLGEAVGLLGTSVPPL